MVESTSSPFWFSPYTGLIRLMCSFKGWPRPRVVWYNPDGKLIVGHNPDSKFIIGESETLSVDEIHDGENVTSYLYFIDIKEEYSGVYKCKAMNNITGWSSTLSEDVELIYNCK